MHSASHPTFRSASHLLRLVALGAGLLCVGRGLAADPGTIVVHVDQPGAKIHPLFYGIMTEEINFSYDGGLYGELIQNRIFKNTTLGAFRPPGGRRGPAPAAASASPATTTSPAPAPDASPPAAPPAPIAPAWSVIAS